MRAGPPLTLATLLILALSTASTRAAPPPTSQEAVAASLGFDSRRLYFALGSAGVVAIPGDFQLVLQHTDPIRIGAVDPEVPGELPAEDATWMRIRIAPLLVVVTPDSGPFSLYRIGAELDIVRDWLSVGDDRDVLGADSRGRVDTGLIGQRLSQLYAQAGGPYGAVQVGLVRSRWGLGLVSNAGDDPVMGDVASPFGTSYQGDHVVRIGGQVTPLGPAPLGDPGGAPLMAALAVDGVIDDDTALWSAGDRAYQVVAAVSGRAGIFRGGLYFAHRWQTHHEGGQTTVNVIDATMRLTLADEPGLRAFLEGEIATIRGSSSLAQSVTHPGSFDVDQLGGVMRFAVQASVFTGVLEVGVASADENPFDDELRAFSFDRDYRVGMLLFRELLAAHAAVGAYNAADPEYRGEPTRGYERIATQGSVRGASYVNPRVDFALLDGDLHLMGGFVYAMSDGDYVDPFWSGLAGGAPRGPRNGARSRQLGWEVDLGAAYAVQAGPIGMRFRVEAAYARPGDVFRSSTGDVQDELWGFAAHMGILW